MKFEDDKPLECEYCGKMIYAGDYARIWNDKCYCSRECVKDAMYEDADISTHWVKTAEEKEAECYEEMTKPLDREIEQEPVLDKIRAEIAKSKTEHEMQIAEKDIKAKLLISDIYCDIANILDKYKAESEEV